MGENISLSAANECSRLRQSLDLHHHHHHQCDAKVRGTMNDFQAEKRLSLIYSGAAIFSTISAISLIVAWQHWAWTLDSCMEIDCECILYGVNAYNSFIGGDVKLCHFATYGLLPATIISLILGVYHGFRSCIDRNLDVPRAIPSRATDHCNRNNFEGEVIIVAPKRRSACEQWMQAAFLAVLISCLSLGHAVVLTDGYYKSCEQYTRYLIKLLGSRGREVEVIYDRLSCGSIFDFMDYLQPDANNWRRGDQINTGVALQLSIVFSWLNFSCFVVIVFINLTMARQRHKILGEKMWCC